MNGLPRVKTENCPHLQVSSPPCPLPPNPRPRISPYEGLLSMTAWAAEQYGEESSKGSLEQGKRADLVILDKNPLTVDPASIKDIHVTQTIKDGAPIWPQKP